MKGLPQEAGEQLRKELQALAKQKERMEALCRTLTTERASLRRTLGMPRSASSSGLD